MCSNKTYNKDCIGKYLSNAFPVQNGLKQGHVLLSLPFNFPFECTSFGAEWNTSAPDLC
jgi:hypothetical protein